MPVEVVSRFHSASDAPPESRKNEGLYKVFLGKLPYYRHPPTTSCWNSSTTTWTTPVYTIEECLDRGLPTVFRSRPRLYLYCTDPRSRRTSPPVIQDALPGHHTLRMTEKGTFRHQRCRTGHASRSFTRSPACSLSKPSRERYRALLGTRDPV